MKQIALCALLCFFIIVCQSQTCTEFKCVNIYGAGTGYEQANLNTLLPNNPQPGVKNVEVFAWTANSAGVPIFNGRTAMKFNLSSIPVGSTITNATAYFQGNPVNNIRSGQSTYTTNTNAALLQKITSTWTETTATWNNQPGVTTTGQKTQAKSTLDNQIYPVDVTDFVQFWINKPDSNFGMMYRILTEQSYNCLVFYGGNAANTANKLRISVCYSTPGVGANSKIIAGNKTNKLSTVLINNNYPNYGFSHPAEITSIAWTNNAEGFSVFNNRTLMRYDVSDVPANATINSARLYLYAKKNPLNGNKVDPMFGSNNVSLLQNITSKWDTTGVATGWNNQPSISSTTQKVLAKSTSTTQDYVVDITDFAQRWINKPDSNFGMLLRLQTEIAYNSMIFEGDAAAAFEMQPRLEICYSNNSTLPLTLIDFNGAYISAGVSLIWNTFNEQNALTTEIQYSTNGSGFTGIGIVKAKNTPGNNKYMFYHKDIPENASKLFYRLKLVNADGSFLLSNIIVLNTKSTGHGKVLLFPNPTKNNSSINVIAKSAQHITINIYNSIGLLVSTQNTLLLKGNNSVVLRNADRFLAGNYFISTFIDGLQLTATLQKQ